MLFSWQNNSTRCWDTTGSDDKSLEPGDEELTPIPQSNNNCLQEGNKCQIFSLVSWAIHDIQVNGGGLELSAIARFITTNLVGDVKSELAKFDWQRGRVVLGKMDIPCVNLYATRGTNCSTLESFRFEDKIFSILSSARARTSVILVGKRGSRRHSTTSFSKNVVMAGTSKQIFEV